MKLKDAVEIAKGSLREFTPLPLSGVTGVVHIPDDDTWIVTIELIERVSIPDTFDILGSYEMVIDNEGDIIEYRRVGARKRNQMTVDMGG